MGVPLPRSPERLSPIKGELGVMMDVPLMTVGTGGGGVGWMAGGGWNRCWYEGGDVGR